MAVEALAAVADSAVVLVAVATLVVEVREAVGNTDRWARLWLRL